MILVHKRNSEGGLSRYRLRIVQIITGHNIPQSVSILTGYNFKMSCRTDFIPYILHKKESINMSEVYCRAQPALTQCPISSGWSADQTYQSQRNITDTAHLDMFMWQIMKNFRSEIIIPGNHGKENKENISHIPLSSVIRVSLPCPSI